jgi:tail fiber protein gp53
MDRRFVYVGAIPQDIDVLQSNLDPYFAVSKLADAVLGKTQILNNFACTPTSPAGMTVNVGYGEVYSLQQVDTSSYGSISPNTNQIVKQGVTFNTTNLSCPAPVTVGYSINYLIQVSFTETDTASVVLPYYNASNINAPLSGPGNSGEAQNTIRQDGVTVSIKTGIAAPTGTQTTPSPDTGYTGAWVVNVAYGQTTITSGNISQYASASFIQETLTQKVSQPTGDLRWAQIQRVQSDYYNFGIDTGSANTYVTALTPALTAYSPGIRISLVVANTNTGASTLNVNGLGTQNIILTNGNTPSAGDIVLGQIAQFEYDGTNFQILNPPRLITALQIQDNSFTYSADTGSANAYLATLSPAIVAYTAGIRISVKIANTNTAASTINVNSVGVKSIKLTNGNAINVGDLLSGQIAEFEYDGTNFQLLNPASTASQIQVQSSSLVYAASTSSANTYTASLTPALSAYTTGMTVKIKFTHANTGAATLNINSVGAASILRDDGSSLVAGDIPASTIVDFEYDGTNFRLSGLRNWQFPVSIGANGYQQLSSGLIMQWGYATLPISGTFHTRVTVTYPIAFPNNVLSIQSTSSLEAASTDIVAMAATSATLSNFVLVAETNTNFAPGGWQAYWLAIGN